MKFITYLAVSAFMFTWMACGHGRPADETVTTEPKTQGIIPANSIGQPQPIPSNLNSNSTPATPSMVTSSTATMPGMNPQHGQPGHRCDIAVGAPLNSAPAQQTSPTATTPVGISANQPVQPSATTAVAAGMNPAHGEPGHRCDIAVGAPLNSKPAQQPATNATTPVTTAVAPGMNPPHGQPGHRCDIAVGAPLNSKPILVTGTPSTNTVTGSQSIPSVISIKPTPEIKKDNK